MTGETTLQPGGRAAAPGELALVQAFINSHYDLEIEHGADLLATRDGLRAWLADRGLLSTRAPVGSAELARARALRETLRALAGRGNAALPADALDALNRAAVGAPVELRFRGGGPAFVASGSGGVSGALGLLLAHTARAMIDGRWARLKLCPGRDCGWAFYDHSRNQSGRWCSMSVCGGREKARAHYRRKREGG